MSNLNSATLLIDETANILKMDGARSEWQTYHKLVSTKADAARAIIIKEQEKK